MSCVSSAVFLVTFWLIGMALALRNLDCLIGCDPPDKSGTTAEWLVIMLLPPTVAALPGMFIGVLMGARWWLSLSGFWLLAFIAVQAYAFTGVTGEGSLTTLVILAGSFALPFMFQRLTPLVIACLAILALGIVLWRILHPAFVIVALLIDAVPISAWLASRRNDRDPSDGIDGFPSSGDAI